MKPSIGKTKTGSILETDMDTDEMRYCLSKQLTRAYAVQTDYGDFALDEEMRAAVENALRPIIEQRLDPGRPIKPHRSGGGHRG